MKIKTKEFRMKKIFVSGNLFKTLIKTLMTTLIVCSICHSQKGPDIGNICDNPNVYYVFDDQIVTLEQDKMHELNNNGTVYFCEGKNYFTGKISARNIQLQGIGNPDMIHVFPVEGFGLILFDSEDFDENYSVDMAGFRIKDSFFVPRPDSSLTHAVSLFRANTKLTVDNVIFENNRAGALKVLGYESRITVTNTGFLNNSTKGGLPLIAVINYNSFKLVDTKIENNSGNSSIVLIGCDDTYSNDEGCVNFIPKIEIENIEIHDNLFTHILLKDSNASIKGMNAYNNGTGGGTGLMLGYIGGNNTYFYLRDSNIANNFNSGIGIYGGEIIEVDGLEFSENTILIDNNFAPLFFDAPEVLVKNSRFSGNITSMPLFYLDQGLLNFVDSKIEGTQFQEYSPIYGENMYPTVFLTATQNAQPGGDWRTAIINFARVGIYHNSPKTEFSIVGLNLNDLPNDENVDYDLLSIKKKISLLREHGSSFYTYNEKMEFVQCEYENDRFICNPCELEDRLDNNWDNITNNFRCNE